MADFSKTTLTPSSTDKILTVSASGVEGHETLSAIKNFTNSDIYTESEVNSLLTGYMKFPIVADAGFHNSIYRGKDITSYWTDGTIHSRIQGTNGYALFEDLFVGDYFTTGSATINGDTRTRDWAIAGFDYLLNVGANFSMDTHHAVIVPCDSSGKGASVICSMAMYDSVPFTGAYYGSNACKAMLADGAITTGMQAIFGSNLLATNELLCTANNTSGIGTNWAWFTIYGCLLSEVEVYGASVWGDSKYDGAMDGRGQLPLFRLKPSMISTRSYNLWLRSLGGGASNFSYTYQQGDADGVYFKATNSYGIRPRFLIK